MFVQCCAKLNSEHLCEKFPRFREPEYRDLLLLHQCYHSSINEETISILENWILRGDGRLTVSQVLKVFQDTLASEVLAMALADMLLLWTLDPPSEEDESQSTPSSLLGLGQLLSERSALRNSHSLLLVLSASFSNAIKVLEAKKSTAIMQFLTGAVCFTESACPSENITGYFLKRLSWKGPDEAEEVTASDIETLVGEFVLL